MRGGRWPLEVEKERGGGNRGGVEQLWGGGRMGSYFLGATPLAAATGLDAFLYVFR